MIYVQPLNGVLTPGPDPSCSSRSYRLNPPQPPARIPRADFAREVLQVQSKSSKLVRRVYNNIIITIIIISSIPTPAAAAAFIITIIITTTIPRASDKQILPIT